jgi:hypothetical protein
MAPLAVTISLVPPQVQGRLAGVEDHVLATPRKLAILAEATSLVAAATP